MFKKSIDGQIEAAITARATFWKAETEYVLDDYKNALLSFKVFQDCLALLLHLNIKISITISPTLISNSRNDQAATYFQNQIEIVKRIKFD
jgi:hypothetical protein